jgi:muconolactone D-isomerase
MEFLVKIEIHWPPDGEPERFSRLAEAERDRAAELSASGTIKRLWRTPGRRANWGLWAAPDATVLHEALSTLPLFPWLEVTVHPLAQHPYDPERPGGR